MARGGGQRGGKGKGGKPTARSQNYLAQYGYPSERELRREAQGLAGASVPTIRSVRRPYQEQMQSTRDFLAAVQSALADTSTGVGAGYDQAIGQSQAVDQAAQARLAGLGLGASSAGVQAAVGARGDAATQNLISNAAAAKNYAAQLPAVAAGSASRQQAGLQKSMLDALQNRRDSLSQAFFQALSQVKSSALQEAGMVQSGQQFQQQMAAQAAQAAAAQAQADRSYNEGVREFNVGQRTAAQQQAWTNKFQRQQFKAQYGYDPITGKGAAGAAALGPMASYSPAQLAEIARASADQLGPTHKVSTTSRDANGRTTGSTSRVVHELPPAFKGQDFTTTVQRMVANGVPQQAALWQATQLYQSLGNVNTAMALAANIFRANGKGVPSLKSFRTSNLWAQMQDAYYSFLQQDPSIYSGNPRG